MKLFKSLIIILLILTSWNAFSQKGNIQGRIFNSASNEPIPFSNVLIKGTNIGATTDLEGKFVILGVAPGFIELVASSLGFETFSTQPVTITNAKTTYIDIPLKETTLQLKEVSVKASRFERIEESPVSLRTINIAEIEFNPGANRDISKVIQSFPGVSSTSINRNDVIVRGGGPNESRFFLDDVEIPNINHFATQGSSGGSNGILNADFIREVEFFSGAFPSDRGNALSGVFNFKQIDGNKEKTRFRGTLGASEVSLTADGPLSKNTTFIISARRSYLSFLFKALGLPFLPTYNDMQFKSRTKINDKNEFILVGLGALDQFKLDTKIKNPDENQRYILSFLPVNEQWNYTIGTVFKHYKAKGYDTYVLSRNMLNNRSYKYKDNIESSSNLIYDYTSQEIENKFRYESFFRTKDNLKIIYGINGEYAKYNNQTYQQIFISNTLDTIDYNSNLELFKWGFFGQISKDFFAKKLSLSLGLRSDATNYSNSMSNLIDQISPRFSASYLLTEKISFNFNTGRYYQLPAYTTLGYRDNTGDLVNKQNKLKYITADHLIAGLEYRPNNNSRITIEGFYKLYHNYPFSLKDSISIANRPANFGTVGDEEVKSISEGRAYGGEFLIQSKIGNTINIVLAYTYVISEFKDKNNNYAPSSWDNRHILILTATKKMKKNWNIGIKWRYAGGLPYTPYDISKSEQVAAWDVRSLPYLDYNQLNGDRFKPFHQLDLRIDKVFYFEKSSLKFYIDIQNLYNFKSQEQDRVTNTDINGVPVYYNNDPTSGKYVLRTIKNDGSGTILPTLGIMFDF